jgi:AcrR family transcriptional regulator
MNNRSGQATKERILDAARRVFAEHGHDQANMRLIARSAGISVGGLYLYFKNKEELSLTLLRESLDGFNRETREALKDIQDPAEALRCFITFTITSATERKEKFLFQDREQAFSFGLEMKKEFFRERRKLIEEIILDGIERNVFRPCDVTEAARIIYSLLRGFFLSLFIDEEALFSAEKCLDLILHGLMRDEGGGHGGRTPSVPRNAV